MKVVKAILDPALAFIARKIKEASDTVARAEDKAADKVVGALTTNTAKQTRALDTLARRLETAVKRMENPTFSGKIDLDTSEFVTELTAITAEINDLAERIEENAPDMEPLERGIQMLLNKLDGFSDSNIVKALDALRKTLESEEKKKKGKQTFLLDEQQFRALRNAGRGGGGGGGGALQARGVTQSNVAVTALDTEYSYTFPANTITWVMRIRDPGALLYYAFAAGTLPSPAGNGTKYSTAPQGFIRAQTGIEWGGKTIYFTSDTASMIAEIEAYTA